MTREEAKNFWLIRYENAKDFNDLNWEAQEREEHREYVEALRMAIEALSADRYGEWIEDKTGNGFWICSSCGFVSEASGAWLLYKYCPNCGANMRKEEDDHDYERAIDNLQYNTIYEPTFNLEDGSM